MFKLLNPSAAPGGLAGNNSEKISIAALAAFSGVPYHRATMNRIYQGRVTQVQMSAPATEDQMDGRKKAKKGEKPEWVKIENGEALLWRHHELFQDAVN